MSTKDNPGAFRCYQAALPDEPIFTILARDPAAPATLRYWAQERQAQGKTVNPDDRDRITDALRDADEMTVWRLKNLDPIGDGSGPSWKNVKITDDDGGPIRMPSTEIVYLPAERDGTEAVRLNVEWLLATCRKLVEGVLCREGFTGLMELACQSPDRRKIGMMPELAMGYSGKPVEHEWCEYSDTEGENPRKVQPLSFTRMSELLDYATGYGEFDENTPNGTQSKEPGIAGDPMNDIRRTAIWVYKRCMGIIPEGAEPPVTDNVTQERVLVDSDPSDLAHSPEVPPHRFTTLHKGEHYAYARGLEVNPQHLPMALDAMAEDGWSLLAIFGQTDSQHVGFVFERMPSPVVHRFDYTSLYDPRAANTAADKAWDKAWDKGVDGDKFRFSNDCLADRGRGQEP